MKSNRDDSAEVRGIEGSDGGRDIDNILHSADRMRKIVEEQKSVTIGLEVRFADRDDRPPQVDRRLMSLFVHPWCS